MPQTRLGHLASISLADIELGLDRVLDQIAVAATELLPATKGASLVVWDAATESFTQGATTVAGQEHMRPDRHVRRTGGTTRWIVDNRTSVVVPDTAHDPFPSNSLVSEYGVGAYVGVPLLDGSNTVGVLYALEDAPQDFSDDDVAFLEALAGRAAEAIVHARFLEEARAARRRAEAVAEAAHDMLSAASVSAVTDAALLAISEALDTGAPWLIHVDPVTGRTIGGRRFVDGRLAAANGSTTAPPLPLPNEAPKVDDTGRVVARVPLRGRSAAILVVDRAEGHAPNQDDIDFIDAVVSTAALAMENLALLDEVNRLAETDHLTGVANRRQFDATADQAMETARLQSRRLSVAMIDADNFKTINDRLGHRCGDEVLAEIAERLQAALRRSDVLARYGGEEFVVLMRDTSEHGATIAAERLRETIAAAPIATATGSVEATVSIGVASLDHRSMTVAELVHEADLALLTAKERGRNRVVAATEVATGQAR